MIIDNFIHSKFTGYFLLQYYCQFAILPVVQDICKKIPMILYNVTVKVDQSAEKDWLDYMRKHVPDVIGTGCFTGYRMCRLLEQPEGDDPTYTIQYECESKAILNVYLEKYAPALREEVNQLFKDRFVAFRTVMEVL